MHKAVGQISKEKKEVGWTQVAHFTPENSCNDEMVSAVYSGKNIFQLNLIGVSYFHTWSLEVCFELF